MGMVNADIGGSLSLSSFTSSQESSYHHDAIENGNTSLSFPFMRDSNNKGCSDFSEGVGENNDKINHDASFNQEINNDHENNNNYVMSGKEANSGESKICSRGHWRPAEDSKLKELVALYGPQNWKIIAEKLEGRSGKSCRLRWLNQLDPRIKRRPFTEEEEERLTEAHRIYGNKWAMIARLFPGRTDNTVKNHWHVIMARNYREHKRRGRMIISSQNRSFVCRDNNTRMETEPSSLPFCINLSSGVVLESFFHGANWRQAISSSVNMISLLQCARNNDMVDESISQKRYWGKKSKDEYQHQNQNRNLNLQLSGFYNPHYYPQQYLMTMQMHNIHNCQSFSSNLPASSTTTPHVSFARENRNEVLISDPSSSDAVTAPPFIDFLGVERPTSYKDGDKLVG